jgi:hypothetical protein
MHHRHPTTPRRWRIWRRRPWSSPYTKRQRWGRPPKGFRQT